MFFGRTQAATQRVACATFAVIDMMHRMFACPLGKTVIVVAEGDTDGADLRIFMTFAVTAAVALVLLLASRLPAGAEIIHRGASCQAVKRVDSGTYGIYCCVDGLHGQCLVRLCPRGPSPKAGQSYVLVGQDCRR